MKRIAVEVCTPNVSPKKGGRNSLITRLRFEFMPSISPKILWSLLQALTREGKSRSYAELIPTQLLLMAKSALELCISGSAGGGGQMDDLKK